MILFVEAVRRTKVSSPCQVLPLLLILTQMLTSVAKQKMGNKFEDLGNSTIVLDVSQIFRNLLEPNSSLPYEWTQSVYVENNSKSRVAFYYEMDLHEKAADEINRLSAWVADVANFEQNAGNNSSHLFVSLRYTKTVWGGHPDGSFLIVPRHFVHFLKQAGNLTSTINLSFEYSGGSCPSGMDRARPPNYFSSVQSLRKFIRVCPECKNIVKLGYTVTQEMMGCRFFYENIIEADFIVAKLTFELYRNFVESYGPFKRYMDAEIQQTSKFLSTMRNDESMVLYHLSYIRNTVRQEPNRDTCRHSILIRDVSASQQSDQFGTMSERMSRCLFNDFVVDWALEGKTNIVIIAMSDDCEVYFDRKLAQKMSTFMPDISNIWHTYRQDCNLLRSLNDLALGGREPLILKTDSWKGMNQVSQLIGSGCRSATTGFQGRNASSWIIPTFIASAYYDFTLMNDAPPKVASMINIFVNETLVNATQSLDGIPEQKLQILLSNSLVTHKGYLESISALCTRNHTNCSCVVPIGLIRHDEMTTYPNDNHITENFMNVLTDSKFTHFCHDFILRIEWEIQESQQSMFQDSQVRDKILRDLKQKVLSTDTVVGRLWQGESVKYEIDGGYHILVSYAEERYETLYCNPTRASFSELFEAMLTWANIHGFDLSLRFYEGGVHPSPLGVKRLLPDKSLRTRTSKMEGMFPMFLRRSYNTSKMYGNWPSEMYPCLEWIYKVPNEPPSKQGNQVGTYVQLNLNAGGGRVLVDSEILIMMMYAIMPFRVTEIRVDSGNDIKSLVAALHNSDFRQNLKNHSIGSREILLKIPVTWDEGNLLLAEPIDDELLNISSPLDEFTLKAHFSVPTKPNQSFEAVLSAISEQLPVSIQIGLELHHCKDIVQYLVTNQYVNFTVDKISEKDVVYNLLGEASYVICNIPSKRGIGYSRWKMQRFLEMHLFVKTILQIYYPNLSQVYFKMLPSQQIAANEMEDFLLLLTHMAKFASSYNLTYLLMPSFVGRSSEKLSWWKISNYTDLSDANVYQDIWSKYLGTKSWRPHVAKRKGFEEHSKSTDLEEEAYWFIVGFAATVVAFVCILVAVMIKARHNARLLSDEDVQEFLKGRTGNHQIIAKDCNGHVLNNKYNNQLEICKSEIWIDESDILGMGRFGVVCKATISNGQGQRKTVAVKMPLKGCEKPIFISFLREVKILGYIGRHPHVVDFIGSYTKEIQDGLLYIVLELCQEGSLSSHLRNMKSGKSKIGQDATSGELFRFCHEIASGMEYMSSKNVVHGDLSAKNVLLDGLKICKISDFGLSRKLYEDGIYSKKTKEPVPWRWMSYESLSRMEFSTMSDVWSYGITIWEIFNLGDIPYPGQEFTDEFLHKLMEGMRPAEPSIVATQVYHIMQECWNIMPDGRPNFGELVSIFAEKLHYVDFLRDE